MVSETIIIAIITAIVSIVGSMAATLLQTKKWQSGELPAQQAGAADVITGTSIELVSALRDEMRILREKSTAELMAVRQEMAVMQIENFEMRKKLEELQDVRDWAERLVHQVRSLGGEPVQMRTRPIRTNE